MFDSSERKQHDNEWVPTDQNCTTPLGTYINLYNTLGVLIAKQKPRRITYIQSQHRQ